VEKINEQKNKLKKGEDLILNSLQKERELNQLKSNFVSIASHEFRTPLAVIRSSIELMQINIMRPGVPLNNIEKHVNNVLSEVDHLSELIDEVLTVGKIESNSLTCKKEAIDLHSFLLKIINSVHSIQNDGRSVTVNSLGIAQPLMADTLLLSHILNNLLSNAFKYSKGKNQPIVTILYEKDDLQIRVKDFGVGIPFDEQGKIFQAFFRAENVHQLPGTGLGMFITKSFIDLHGGQISFKSIPEKGTEFTIWIPYS
jgi:signal transduction histidine kinase